jgi:hypothetical protein
MAVSTQKKESITLECSEEPKDQERVNYILENGKKNPWEIVSVKESEQKLEKPNCRFAIREPVQKQSEYRILS